MKPIGVAVAALALIAALGMLMIAGSCVVFGLVMGRTTEYCPWSHRISDTSNCVVLDRADGRVLIEHGDFDTNRYYLEIRSGRSSEEFEVPPGLPSQIPGDVKVSLVPGAKDEIAIAGRRQRLERR